MSRGTKTFLYDVGIVESIKFEELLHDLFHLCTFSLEIYRKREQVDFSFVPVLLHLPIASLVN